MNILQTIVLGIVEGITEFLPVSSTFHLIFASKFLGIPQTEFAKVFEVVIQSGAILSVFFIYSHNVVKDKRLLTMVIASFLPTAIIGLVLHKVIKDVFFELPLLMVSVFILVGGIFVLVEWLINNGRLKDSQKIEKMSYRDAVIIGLVQALAVIPGVSRAGAVIIGMMFLGYKRDESAYYSFLLAVPTILAASALDIIKSRDILFQQTDNILLLLVGFAVSFISSYFGVKWFIKYLQKHSLQGFGFYRILVGFILLSLILTHII